MEHERKLDWDSFRTLIREVSTEALNENPAYKRLLDDALIETEPEPTEEELELQHLKEEKEAFANILQDAINDIGEDVEE